MKSPPKMLQRAMVRIWVASLHQKTSTYESTLRFLFYCKARLTGRVDSNNIGPPNSPAGKKAPVQQRRPLPAAEAGRSCWGCGQQDARAAQGTTQPLGAATRVPFYFARLATSTRAHQKTSTYHVAFPFSCFISPSRPPCRVTKKTPCDLSRSVFAFDA